MLRTTPPTPAAPMTREYSRFTRESAEENRPRARFIAKIVIRPPTPPRYDHLSALPNGQQRPVSADRSLLFRPLAAHWRRFEDLSSILSGQRRKPSQADQNLDGLPPSARGLVSALVKPGIVLVRNVIAALFFKLAIDANFVGTFLIGRPIMLLKWARMFEPIKAFVDSCTPHLRQSQWL